MWGSMQLYRSHAYEAGIAPKGRLHWTDLKLLSNSHHLKKNTYLSEWCKEKKKKKANTLKQLSKLLRTFQKRIFLLGTIAISYYQCQWYWPLQLPMTMVTAKIRTWYWLSIHTNDHIFSILRHTKHRLTNSL